MYQTAIEELKNLRLLDFEKDVGGRRRQYENARAHSFRRAVEFRAEQPNFSVSAEFRGIWLDDRPMINSIANVTTWYSVENPVKWPLFTPIVVVGPTHSFLT